MSDFPASSEVQDSLKNSLGKVVPHPVLPEMTSEFSESDCGQGGIPCSGGDPSTSEGSLKESFGIGSCGSSPEPGIASRSPLDGCPTPISWEVVLREFRQHAPWQEVSHATGPIRYRVWGSGPVLYLVNGMGGTIDHLALVSYLLKDLFTCVIPEYPSVSEPGHHCFRLRIDDLADRIITVADQRGEKNFSLFATSLGSLVSLKLMSLHPGRVTKGVLAGGFAHRQLSIVERGLIQIGSWLPIRLRSLPLAGFIHEQTHRPWFPPIDPTRWNYFEEISGELSVQDLAWRGRMIRNNNLTRLLPQIQTPLLLIQGEGDGLVSGKCRDVLQSQLPHAEVEMMANTGHLPHITHPHRLGKSIRNYLTGPACTQ